MAVVSHAAGLQDRGVGSQSRRNDADVPLAALQKRPCVHTWLVRACVAQLLVDGEHEVVREGLGWLEGRLAPQTMKPGQAGQGQAAKHATVGRAVGLG
eukprot:2813223-Lingulodinium_polyedra.AAC.1